MRGIFYLIYVATSWLITVVVFPAVTIAQINQPTTIPHATLTKEQLQVLSETAALDQTVIQLYLQGQYTKLTPLAEKSFRLKEKVLGSDNPYLLQSLYQLATIYLTVHNDYQKGEHF